MARRPEAADCAGIVALHNKWLAAYGPQLSYEPLSPWDESKALYCMDSPNHACWVAEDKKGNINGFLCVAINEEPHRVALWVYDPDQNHRQQTATIADMGLAWTIWEQEQYGLGRQWCSMCPILRDSAVRWLETQPVTLSEVGDPNARLYYIEGGIDDLRQSLEGPGV